MNKENLEKVIKENRERNRSLLGFIHYNPIYKIYREKDSLLVLGESDHLWAFVCSDSLEELQTLMKYYKFETYYFASIEEWMVPVITCYCELEWSFSTDRYIYPEEMIREKTSLSLRTLDPSIAPYIYYHSVYKEYTTVEYIQERICKDVSSGLFIDNRLVAWGLTHDDGALGFLHVLPVYRGKGYGREIMKNLIEKKEEKGQDIFINIESTNNRGRRFFKRLGFVWDRKVHWIKLNENGML